MACQEVSSITSKSPPLVNQWPSHATSFPWICKTPVAVVRHRRRTSFPHACRGTVRDDNAGVAATMRGVLFEPFRGSKPDGMGLGLAIPSSKALR